MKKYYVIGDPISHSLSPKLHNYWIRQNNINALYEKALVKKTQLKDYINKIKNNEIHGLNVTVPHKKNIIEFLDELTPESKRTESVNTVYKKNGRIVGHNTDIAGFELAIRQTKYDIDKKRILIIGAGGVVPSLVAALLNLSVTEITIMNRTYNKAIDLVNKFKNLKIIKWGYSYDYDMIINATSLGIKREDKLEIDHHKLTPNRFFYDIIYNPKETNFLKRAKENSNRVENGKMMFIYQAHQSFTLWHEIMPKINNEVINLI